MSDGVKVVYWNGRESVSFTFGVSPSGSGTTGVGMFRRT